MQPTTSFETLPLAAPLQRALSEKGYATPTPIQAEAIPSLLERRDLLGAAQTGTGKTAAFALPILHHLHANPRPLKRNRARVLALTPTRELAVQVADSFKAYGKHMKLACALVYGGVSAGPQINAMKRGVDILVATPGRLLDLRERGVIDFSGVDHFVLDEADRMLDMGFIDDIRNVVAELPKERQSLFFSATLSPEIVRLANAILDDPAEARIAPKKNTAEHVDHRVCFVRHEDKMALLNDRLNEETRKPGGNRTLVFSRTKHGADALAKALNRSGVRSEAIHGDKNQNARQRALDRFRSGRAPVLVATDVAARGIDVKDINLVVNYDLPDEPAAYVHRIGRTARAGAEGAALSFCTERTLKELSAIERLIAAPVPALEEHGYHCERIASRRRASAESKGSAKGKTGKHGFGKTGKSGGGKKGGRKPGGFRQNGSKKRGRASAVQPY